MKSKRRRRAEVEREACHLREDNEREVNESEDNEREDNVMVVND